LPVAAFFAGGKKKKGSAMRCLKVSSGYCSVT
jgi:hypothetical protein